MHGQRHARTIGRRGRGKLREWITPLLATRREAVAVHHREKVRAGRAERRQRVRGNIRRQRVGLGQGEPLLDHHTPHRLAKPPALARAKKNRKIDRPASFIPAAKPPRRRVVTHRLARYARKRKLPVVDNPRPLRRQMGHPAVFHQPPQQRSRAVFDHMRAIRQHHRRAALASGDNPRNKRIDLRPERAHLRRPGQRVHRDRLDLQKTLPRRERPNLQT